MRRDALMVALLWLFLTGGGEALAVTWNFLPAAAADKAQTIDHAFRVLVILGIPVCTFVFAALVYSVVRFRRKGEPEEDGPPIRSSRPVVATWLAVTTALTILTIIFPGTTGLLELKDNGQTDDDLVVLVEGSRWVWKISYPQQNVTTFTELVLPVGQQVRFDVTATDVLHAFWVPAFRMKVDAVPGRVTTVTVTPDRTGTFDDDSGFRLQCAELCGLAHSAMKVPVRVLEPAEFEAWAAQGASAQTISR